MGYLSGWSTKIKLTYDSGSIGLSADVSNEAVVVYFTSSDTEFWSGIKSDGTDVRFTSDDGTTLLPFEIERFDYASQIAFYHVKIPTIFSTAITLAYCYVGNAAASSGADKEGTWDSRYKGVYHLSQNKPEGAFDDSTTNNHDITNAGSTDSAGQIDRGRYHDQNRELNCGNWHVGDTVAVDIWIETSLTANYQIFVARHYSSTNGSFYLTGLNTNTVRFTAINLTPSRTDLNYAFTYADGVRRHFAGVYDGANMRLYINGVEVASTPKTGLLKDYSTNLHIGDYDGPDWKLVGTADEVTIGTAPNNPGDWAKVRYQSGLQTWLTKTPDVFSASVISTSVVSAILSIQEGMWFSGSALSVSTVQATLSMQLALTSACESISSVSASLVTFAPAELILVGSVTDTTAKILVRTTEISSTAALEYKTSSQAWAEASMTGGIDTIQDSDYTAIFNLTGLSAATPYNFRVYIAGVLDGSSEGGFKTFPAQDTPVNFTFGTGSCLRSTYRPHTILNEIVGKAPEFFMMIGDNVYADSNSPFATTFEEFKDVYYTDATPVTNYGHWNESNFKAFAKNQPTFLVSDDHEIENDWDEGKTGKWIPARKAYQIYQNSTCPDSPDDISGICETGTAGTTLKDAGAFADADVGDIVFNTTTRKITHIAALIDTDSVTLGDSGYFAVGDGYLIPRFYYSFKYGDIEFFLIDDSSYRSPMGATDDASKTLLGSRQKTWLKNAIVNSTAKWKLLITPTALSFQGTSFPWAWGAYSTERQEILNHLSLNRVEGLVALTGDFHSARAWKLQGATPAKPFNYPWIYEFMSSKLAGQSIGSDYGDTADRLYKYAATSYYMLFKVDTTAADPTFTAEVYALGNPTAIATTTIYLSRANGLMLFGEAVSESLVAGALLKHLSLTGSAVAEAILAGVLDVRVLTISDLYNLINTRPTLSEMLAGGVAKEATVAAILALVTKFYKMEIGRLKQTDNPDGTKTFEYFEDDAEQILTISFTLDATGKIRSVGV